MKHMPYFPNLFARVPSLSGLLGVLPTCVRVFALASLLALYCPAFAQTATTTTMTITSDGDFVSSVNMGSAVTLTATVTAGSTPVTPGTINFCDATAAHCTDIHIVGTAQLTSSGEAVIKFRPGFGSRSYKAVFVGTKTYAGSSSGTASLTVTAPVGGVPTTTAITPPGFESNSTLIATVSTFSAGAAPTGTVSFLDASDGNAVLGTADLAPASPSWSDGYPYYLTGAFPVGIASADFNGDGIPDLAITNNPQSSVRIFLGNGDGTFTQVAENPTAGTNPAFIVTGDFDGDGIPDLAYIFSSSFAGLNYPNSVAILLGNGDGTFTQKATLSIGEFGSAQTIAVADLNHDGILDLAIPNASKDTVAIFLGNGDGTFTQTSDSPAAGDFVWGVAAADFNGDGVPDLAVTDNYGGGVAILLGNGDGTFALSNIPGDGGNNYPEGIVAADFNGDGIPDLAVANEGSDTISILIGTGTGTFTAGEQPQTFMNPAYIAVADFTGNGTPDLAVASGYDGSNTYLTSTATVLLGNGDGTFTPAASSPALQLGPENLVAVDFNGDGVSDLAVTNNGSENVSIILTSNSAIATLSGISTPLGPQAFDVEASYAGDSKYSSSISSLVNLQVPPTAQATLTTPTPFSVLGPGNATFRWTAGTGVTEYQLTLGTTGPGSSDLHSFTGSATSTVVSAPPSNGATIYARLSSKINGSWLYNDYLFTEYSPPAGAVLETPTPGLGTKLGTSKVVFHWSPVAGIIFYQFTLGTTGPGSSDILFLTSTATSVMVPTLPANGVTMYARMVSVTLNGNLTNDYLYTESSAAVPAVLTSPTPGSSTVLGTSGVTFQWTAGTDVSLYELTLGTVAPGTRDLYVYKGTATSATVPSLPANGVTVYATLSSYIAGAWQRNSYLYRESGALVPAVLTSPSPGLGTVIGTSNVPFQWTTGTGVYFYQLNLSAIAPGASDLFVYKGTATTTSVPSLPANGAIVYARLYSNLNGTWVYDDSVYFNDSVYTESGTPAAGVLTTPTPGLGTMLGTTDVTFQWTAGAGATDYELNLSAIAPGGRDLYVYKGPALSATAPSLPANGVKVYARLYSHINGAWQYNDYFYTEQ